MYPSWDDYFMTMAYLVAMRSKDKSTHIGAVVVDKRNRVMSTGYNSFPTGINDDVDERQERPEKYYWFEHAERNAIYNAGRSLEDCRMYTNGVPCMDCARAVVQAGIKEVIVDGNWDSSNDEMWMEHNKRSIVLFHEAGVTVNFHNFKPVDIHRFRRGERTEL